MPQESSVGQTKYASIRVTSRHGFTLIELVVAISVGAIVSGTAGMLLWNASNIRAETSARSELTDEASAAMEVMLRYVREIRQDECPGGPTPCLYGNAQVITASATELDFDTDGFRQSGSTLEITNDTGATWHPLVRDVSSLIFTYYDRNNVVLSSLPLSAADRQAIRRVGMRLVLTSGTQSATLQTSIYLRNFMNEVANAP